MKKLLGAALLASLFAVSAQAQPGPPRRAHHSLIYDESRARVILTGGSTPLNGGNAFEFFNDVWEFDGTAWKQLPSSGDQRSGSALAWDAGRKRVVSFGGYRGQSLADVRALVDGAWSAIGLRDESPAAEPGFVYDSRENRFVAFGGSGGRGRMDPNTWIFDGSTWTKLSIESPPARQSHAMAFDSRRGRTVVFGGMGSAPIGQRPPLFDDTWELDGTKWERVSAAGPSARNGAGVAYDSKRGLMILFGGSDKDGFKGDTWSYDGKEWKLLTTTGPEPRVMGYLAYDSRRDRIVMFGGRKGWPDGDLNDTWEWDGSAWRRVQ